jgi:hypothetical protein
MSDDKKPAPKPTDAPRNRIPVKMLTLSAAAKGLDLFKSQSLPAEYRTGISRVESGSKGAHKIEIAFYPQLQHHRIALTPPNNAPVEVVMVPAEWCFWTPAEE